ncbi:hypothetical protein H4582DRAFT_1956089, partial [Lactarius indigo]
WKFTSTVPSRTHGGPSTERVILLEALLYALLSLILVAELTRDGDNLYSIHFTDSVLSIHLSIPLIVGARFHTTPLPLVPLFLVKALFVVADTGAPLLIGNFLIMGMGIVLAPPESSPPTLGL